jgi:hypothetical protein
MTTVLKLWMEDLNAARCPARILTSELEATLYKVRCKYDLQNAASGPGFRKSGAKFEKNRGIMKQSAPSTSL